MTFSSGQGRTRSSGRSRAESIVFDLILLDGPPWGFSLSGGEEFGTNLVVAEIDLKLSATKKLRLLCGDEIVAINDTPISSLNIANQLLEESKDNVLLTLRRKYTPNNRRSYHERSMNRTSSSASDISRSSIESTSDRTAAAPKTKDGEEEGTVMRRLSRTIAYQEMGSNSEEKSSSSPSRKASEEKRLSMSRDQTQSPGLPDAIKRVTIKSVNVPGSASPTQDTYSAYLSSQQAQANRESFRARQPSSSKRYDADVRFQSRSFSSLTNVGHDGGGAAPNPYQHWKEGPSSGVETTANMNVASAKAMFEEISKSQENLLNIGLPQPKTRADRRATLDPQSKLYTSIPVSSLGQPTDFHLSNGNAGHRTTDTAAVRRAKHSHSHSLPADPERTLQRDDSFENDDRSRSAGMPPIKTMPPPPPRYSRSKLLSSFREKRRSQPIELFEQFNTSQSVEDLRQLHNTRYNSTAAVDRENDRVNLLHGTQPASDMMREAAKKFHQQVGQIYPAAYRYSVGGSEPIDRQSSPQIPRSASIGVSSSVAATRREPPAVAPKHRPSNALTKASSTSSINTGSFEEIFESDVFSPPSCHQEPPIDSNSIMSKLMRDQQLNNNPNLIRIAEERRGVVSVVDACTSPTVPTRSISMQPEPVMPSRGDQEAQGMQDNHFDYVDERLANQEESSEIYHSKEASTDSMDELESIRDGTPLRGDHTWMPVHMNNSDDFPPPPPPDELLMDTPVVTDKKPTRTINRRKRDNHPGQSRSSSCVSNDSTMSTATSDSGIVYRSCLSSESSPRTSPSDYRNRYDSDDLKNDDDDDEAFGGSRDMLDDCGTDDVLPHMAASSPIDGTTHHDYGASPITEGTPSSTAPSSRRSSSYFSPKLEALDSEKSQLVQSMHDKIRELKEQEREISEEITTNDELGEKVKQMVERCAKQTEFAKFELFIGELNKIVVLLLSLTQRLHRYELMLQDLDMAEEEDKQKRDNLISKIEKLKSQHEEACYLRDVNDKRGENVANFLEKYCEEEEFADFQYFIDMKSQLALMQSEIKEKVKLGEERLEALERAGFDWGDVDCL